MRKRHKTQIQFREKVNEKSLERSKFKSVAGLEDDMDVYESEPIFDVSYILNFKLFQLDIYSNRIINIP